MLRLQSYSIKSRLWASAQDNFLIHENNNQQLPSPDLSPGLTYLHLGVHVPVDGRQPVDRGQAATSPRTGTEHPLLVLVECSQTRVMSRCLQLVSARHTRTVRMALPTDLPLTPWPQGKYYFGGGGEGKGLDKLKDPLLEVA